MTIIARPAVTDCPSRGGPHRDQRLRASPTFALAFTLDGRPYVAREVEPYTQLWLSEPERILLSLFSSPRGETVEGAIEAYLRLAGRPGAPPEIGRLRSLVREMRAAGVLMGADDDTSRYDFAMAANYLRHRPFPPELADLIAREGSIAPGSHVLDLAGGPGSLALALAERSQHVSLMDLSRGFIAAAAREARRCGVELTVLHDSCNRLVAHEQAYDVITISQALHWLDDVLVCRGIDRVLRQGGSFFAILSAISIEDHHPLAFLLGDHSVLGAKAATPFEQQAHALLRRLTLLFEAVHHPGRDRIVPTSLRLFRQSRPFGLGYARAFMSPKHVEMTGLEPGAFWSDVDLRCAMATSQQQLGGQDWAVLHFRRGGAPWAGPAPGETPVADIGWHGLADD